MRTWCVQMSHSDSEVYCFVNLVREIGYTTHVEPAYRRHASSLHGRRKGGVRKNAAEIQSRYTSRYTPPMAKHPADPPAPTLPITNLCVKGSEFTVVTD